MTKLIYHKHITGGKRYKVLIGQIMQSETGWTASTACEDPASAALYNGITANEDIIADTEFKSAKKAKQFLIDSFFSFLNAGYAVSSKNKLFLKSGKQNLFLGNLIYNKEKKVWSYETAMTDFSIGGEFQNKRMAQIALVNAWWNFRQDYFASLMNS